MSIHVLVPCSKKKKDVVHSVAVELYDSTLFKKSVAYARGLNAQFSILSAKHGLLHPGDPISNYDMSMNQVRGHDRKVWSLKVAQSIIELQEEQGFTTLVILAGVDYYLYLSSILKLLMPDVLVYIPMQGMGIGERLHWLSTRGVAA